MTLELAIVGLLFLLVLGLLGLIVRFHGRRPEWETPIARLEARLDEQGKRGDALASQLSSQGRVTEDVVRKLDQDLRELQATTQRTLLEQLAGARQQQQEAIHSLLEATLQRSGELRQGLDQRHAEALKTLQETLQDVGERLQRQVAEALDRNAAELGKRMEGLTESTDQRLHDISGQVERRLSEGFEKTTATFADVLQRLALIDEAQKKITELSSNVVSLQEVLADRTSRGVFGEVQLHGLVRNVLPESSYAMQYSLSNSKVVDCMLFLPEPTGNVPIDSKFPLENYRRKTDPSFSEDERKAAAKNFARDVRLHIQDVAGKYIIPGETAGGAVLFIPAEAVFADIHAHHPELVEEAQKGRVWMASPTTLMAILTTASAVLRDAATRQQVNIIQEHLTKLAQDFGRFQTRMDNLAQHIGQAHRDVEEVHRSARKITSRFSKIERLELGDGDAPALPEGEPDSSEGQKEPFREQTDSSDSPVE